MLNGMPAIQHHRTVASACLALQSKHCTLHVSDCDQNQNKRVLPTETSEPVMIGLDNAQDSYILMEMPSR